MMRQQGNGVSHNPFRSTRIKECHSGPPSAAPLLPRRPPLPLRLLCLLAQQRLLRLQAGHQLLAIPGKWEHSLAAVQLGANSRWTALVA